MEKARLRMTGLTVSKTAQRISRGEETEFMRGLEHTADLPKLIRHPVSWLQNP